MSKVNEEINTDDCYEDGDGNKWPLTQADRLIDDLIEAIERYEEHCAKMKGMTLKQLNRQSKEMDRLQAAKVYAEKTLRKYLAWRGVGVTVHEGD